MEGPESALRRGPKLPSVLQLLSISLSFVSFISLATVLLWPTFGDSLSINVIGCRVDSLGEGDSLESDRCKLGRPLRRNRRKLERSLVSIAGGDLWSVANGPTLNDSPKLSRNPLIGVGMMLMRLGGISLAPLDVRGTGLPTDWSSSESTSAIRNNTEELWPL